MSTASRPSSWSRFPSPSPATTCKPCCATPTYIGACTAGRTDDWFVSSVKRVAVLAPPWTDLPRPPGAHAAALPPLKLKKTRSLHFPRAYSSLGGNYENRGNGPAGGAGGIAGYSPGGPGNQAAGQPGQADGQSRRIGGHHAGLRHAAAGRPLPFRQE